ncbi:MAG: CoA pyrophosphatase [Alphaproteobacteria bacterium]|nr:CoA pyrophosphatase [Alphaproteobacteria bacterium]
MTRSGSSSALIDRGDQAERALITGRMAAYVAGKRGRAVEADARPAAVLVPLFLRATGATVLLTRRAPGLAVHAGQISFPGGRIEPSDASPEAAALREAQEEVGLDAGCVELLGRLDTYGTGTGFAVVPIVGLIDAAAVLRPYPMEVAEVFEVPLDFLRDRRNHAVRRWQEASVERSAPELRYEGRAIWGATAGMLINLCDVLAG